jgi:hypothetical protein
MSFARDRAMNHPDREDWMLTTAQVASMAHRDIRYIRSLIERGLLPAVKNERGRYLILASDAGRVMAQRPRGQGRGGGRPRKHPKR